MNVNNYIGKIIHDDCLDIMKNLSDKSIDLVLTDPPYLINYKTGRRKDKFHKFNNEILNDDNYNLIKKYIKECWRILKNNAAIYMFCNCRHIDYFKIEFEKYFNLRNIIVWVKNNWSAGDLNCSFGRQYEFLLLGNKGKKKINGKRLSDVWNCSRVSEKELLHQNQKPLSIIQQCLISHSNIDDLVFDGFAGSGTTALACIELNRRYICVEKDLDYYNIAAKRINIAQNQLKLFD